MYFVDVAIVDGISDYLRPSERQGNSVNLGTKGEGPGFNPRLVFWEQRGMCGQYASYGSYFHRQ
jgi:hypothetical protein